VGGRHGPQQSSTTLGTSPSEHSSGSAGQDALASQLLPKTQRPRAHWTSLWPSPISGHGSRSQSSAQNSRPSRGIERQPQQSLASMQSSAVWHSGYPAVATPPVPPAAVPAVPPLPAPALDAPPAPARPAVPALPEMPPAPAPAPAVEPPAPASAPPLPLEPVPPVEPPSPALGPVAPVPPVPVPALPPVPLPCCSDLPPHATLTASELPRINPSARDQREPDRTTDFTDEV
jgi:hypothetical protein